MQGVVQKIGSTRNGAPFYTIDGKDYFLSRDISEPPTQGAKVEFEFEEFGEAKGKWGRPRRISKWQPVRSASGKPETGSTVSEADILRSISNVVGNACAAGIVKSPEELEKWFVAARAGFANCMQAEAPPKKAVANGVDPEFNDDMPASFYEQQPEPGASRW